MFCGGIGRRKACCARDWMHTIVSTRGLKTLACKVQILIRTIGRCVRIFYLIITYLSANGVLGVVIRRK